MATLHGKSSGRRRTAQPLATVALALAVIGALVLSSASFGYRLGWWDVGTAFTILLASVFAAAAILLLALDALVAGLVARHWAGVGAPSSPSAPAPSLSR